jgi:hypothetical protein
MVKSARSGLTTAIERLSLRVSTIIPEIENNRIVVCFTTEPTNPRELQAAWDQAAAVGDAPPRSYTGFDVRPSFRPGSADAPTATAEQRARRA